MATTVACPACGERAAGAWCPDCKDLIANYRSQFTFPELDPEPPPSPPPESDLDKEERLAEYRRRWRRAHHRATMALRKRYAREYAVMLGHYGGAIGAHREADKKLRKRHPDAFREVFTSFRQSMGVDELVARPQGGH